VAGAWWSRITSSLAEASGTFNARAVAQGFAAILAVIHTPAGEPKLRGKSQVGLSHAQETRYPVVKKYIKTEKISETAEPTACLKA